MASIQTVSAAYKLTDDKQCLQGLMCAETPSILILNRGKLMFEKLTTWWGGVSPETKPISEPINPLNPQGLKPCCACPETKRARDECYMQNNPDIASEKCKMLVTAHVKCMRGYGFEI